MRVKIVTALLHWLIHNGNMPASVIVNPAWVQTVSAFLKQLDVTVTVKGDSSLDNGDVKLKGEQNV